MCISESEPRTVWLEIYLNVLFPICIKGCQKNLYRLMKKYKKFIDLVRKKKGGCFRLPLWSADHWEMLTAYMCLWVQLGEHYRRAENILDKIKCIFSLKEFYCKMFRGNDQGKIKNVWLKTRWRLHSRAGKFFETYCGSWDVNLVVSCTRPSHNITPSSSW